MTPVLLLELDRSLSTSLYWKIVASHVINWELGNENVIILVDIFIVSS